MILSDSSTTPVTDSKTIIVDEDDVGPESHRQHQSTITTSETQRHRRRSSVGASIASAVETIDSKVHAYEREPVPEESYKGVWSFLGLFTSRHTAGTEFAIGPLFVARGSSATDIIVGLFVGNFLAVLFWRFLVAPLAVSKRLTMYYAGERVVGRRLMLVYDAISAILLAGLAGAMFTVSATAFAAMSGIDSPELTDTFPNSAAFVGIVIGVGLITTFVAAVGFTFVTIFGTLMSPVLFAGIIYLFVESLRMLGIGQDGCQLWCILSEKVYTGQVVEGQTKFGMAHCIAFSAFVDLQLNIGQNDLSLLRFAKNKHMGWTSAGGMIVGHYFAWIVAGCMYAVQLQDDPTNTSVAPGPIAELVGGVFGLIIIVIAGWSTANPVIYSSGLGVQHIFPRMHAWQSTILIGLVATVAACFPALTNRIIEFLAFAGIILCPMGIIIFSDHFLLPRSGLQSEYSFQHRENEDSIQTTNWPAVITWASAEILSIPLVFTPVSVYFTPLVTILYSFIAYIGVSKLFVHKGWMVYKIGNGAAEV